VPVPAPVAVPVTQRLVAEHQPQPPRIAHDEQVVEVLQVSVGGGGGGASQEPLVQAQSPQLPLLGPVAVPLWQRLVALHHPQPPRAEHEEQVVEVAQVSVGGGGGAASQEPLVQAQSPQVPLLGPMVVPLWQRSVPLHQPQPPRAEHEEQVVEVAQGSVVAGAAAQTPASQLRPEQQSESLRQRCEPVRHAQWPLMQRV
jgi:hypothetical protein